MVLAFFDEHLKNGARKSFKPEARPITDGLHNPYPAQTVPVDSPELLVDPERDEERSMRSYLEAALTIPPAETLDLSARLVPWAKYGKIRVPADGSSLVLRDSDLPFKALDQRSCTYLGLGVCEFVAQVLHIMLPGGIEGWEKSTLGPTGDVVSSLIGSMNALMETRAELAGITEVRADGPRSSLVIQFLKGLRPNLHVIGSKEWGNWEEIYDSQDPVLIQPLARYLRWPFKTQTLQSPLVEDPAQSETIEGES